MNPYWENIPTAGGLPVRLHHKPRPLYSDRGRLVGYVCDCCDTVYSPNMRATGPYLSNQPPPARDGRRPVVMAHQAPHRPPVFHRFDPETSRPNRRHAARVAARRNA